MEQSKLLTKMTLEDKAKLLAGGSEMTTHGIEELGIPSVQFSDGPHGVKCDKKENRVMFPSLCLVGSTWDKTLVQKLGEALAEGCIEAGVSMLLAPGMNIKRHILNGRNFEYLAEDPVLAGEMGAAYINGLQKKGVGACLKHFAANNQETKRDYVSVDVDERTLREIYLKGFEIAIKKGNPYAVMCAYNKISAVWCSENKFLLTQILRDEWNYDGFVMSDWYAVHDSCKAIRAGLDLRMPYYEHMVRDVKEGVAKGVVSEQEIDEAVTRVLNYVTKEKPVPIEFDRNKQHEIAKEVASAGIVLLKNENNALPINSKKYKKIAVVGEFASKPLIGGQGSSQVFVDEKYVDSPVDALQNCLEGVEVQYKECYQKAEYPSHMHWPKFTEFVEFAWESDAIILFVGSMISEDSEFLDRRDANFNPTYEKFIDTACQMEKKVIVVIQSGSAMILGEWRHRVDAIVEMWLGGEAAGSAIADVLSGKVNPSGKLAETFPIIARKDLEYPGDFAKVRYTEGMDVGYRYYDKHSEEICYPFGHGLSYTRFEYKKLNINVDKDTIQVTFELSNVGDLDGAEVVQVYVGDPISNVYKPMKELKAFEKVHLKSRERQLITIGIPLTDLSYYNTLLKEWIVEKGDYDIYVGASSQDIRLQSRIYLNGTNDYTI